MADDKDKGLPRMGTQESPYGTMGTGALEMRPEDQAPEMASVVPPSEAPPAMGAPAPPESVLGTDVPAGQKIPENRMKQAEHLSESPHAEEQFRGKQEFHNRMKDFGQKQNLVQSSMLALNPNDPDYLNKLAAHHAAEGVIREEKSHYEQSHPWGSMQSAHPGILGKIGHVAGEIGNIAGNAIAPQVTANIPGSQLNLAGEANKGAGEVAEAGKEAKGAAETGETEAKGEAEKELASKTGQEETNLENKPAVEPTLLQDYTKAVQEAVSHGQDPSKSPKVQQLQDAITGIQRQPNAPEKTPAHITTMGPDGKSHIMERDPATGQYSIDRGVAPPNYAQVLPQTLETKTTELLGPDGVQHRYQYNDATRKYDIDMGPAPTGQAGHQIFQAAAIEKLGPQIIADINANREILGNLSSYYKQWLSGTPVGDPKAGELMAELMSFAATQPALHAFRSTNAMEAFEKMVGGLAKNPDAIIASINGMMKLPQTFTNLPQRGGSQKGGNTPPAGGPLSVKDWLAQRQATQGGANAGH